MNQLGQLGEDKVLEHYLAEGYALLARNYHSRLGEIDLVMQKDGEIVFCEVKTRTGQIMAAPREWVDKRKQQKLLKTALHYLSQHNLGDAPLRFDVAEVTPGPKGQLDVHLIKNAFGG